MRAHVLITRTSLELLAPAVVLIVKVFRMRPHDGAGGHRGRRPQTSKGGNRGRSGRAAGQDARGFGRRRSVADLLNACVGSDQTVMTTPVCLFRFRQTRASAARIEHTTAIAGGARRAAHWPVDRRLSSIVFTIFHGFDLVMKCRSLSRL